MATREVVEIAIRILTELADEGAVVGREKVKT
jgi:hypothetical protein